MENKSFMVSKEIADEIDERQFKEEDPETSEEISNCIIIRLETDDVVIPGIVSKYSYKTDNYAEEISFTFLTGIENLVQFQQEVNNFSVAKLMVGSESVGNYDLNGMEVKRMTVEQSAAQAGCVITVVYK